MAELMGADKKDNEKKNASSPKQEVKSGSVVNGNNDAGAKVNNNAKQTGAADKTMATTIVATMRKLLKLDDKKDGAPEKPATARQEGFMAKLMGFLMKSDSNVVAVASKAQEATQAAEQHGSKPSQTKSSAQTKVPSSKIEAKKDSESNADIVIIQKSAESQEKKGQPTKK